MIKNGSEKLLFEMKQIGAEAACELLSRVDLAGSIFELWFSIPNNFVNRISFEVSLHKINEKSQN